MKKLASKVYNSDSYILEDNMLSLLSLSSS